MSRTNDSRLKQVLSDVFDVPVTSVTDDSSPDNIEAWDSLNHLKLVLALESEFDVSFTEEQTVEIVSVQLIKLVLAELGVTFEGGPRAMWSGFIFGLTAAAVLLNSRFHFATKRLQRLSVKSDAD